MFRCDHCENYRDKSEARENPSDEYSCICEECTWALEEEAEKKEDEFFQLHCHGKTVEEIKKLEEKLKKEHRICRKIRIYIETLPDLAEEVCDEEDPKQCS